MSKDLVAELLRLTRDWPIDAAWDSTGKLLGRAADEIEARGTYIDWADKEIERLTAELNHELAWKANIQKINVEILAEKSAVMAECDRLASEAKSAAAHIAALGDLRDRDVAEIARLRAALVAIEAEIHRPISAAHMAQEMWHHARKALAGGEK